MERNLGLVGKYNYYTQGTFDQLLFPVNLMSFVAFPIFNKPLYLEKGWESSETEQNLGHGEGDCLVYIGHIGVINFHSNSFSAFAFFENPVFRKCLVLDQNGKKFVPQGK